jgi:hypothetical protein
MVWSGLINAIKDNFSKIGGDERTVISHLHTEMKRDSRVVTYKMRILMQYTI